MNFKDFYIVNEEGEQEYLPDLNPTLEVSMSDSEYAAPPCSTDCRSNEGVTVGLIDGIIAIARVLRHRQTEGVAISEALTDLRSDEDVAWLFNMSNASIT